MSARRFEFIAGSSSKFWECAVAGASVTIRFGRIGSAGQGQTRQFPTGVAAAKFAEQQIAAKLAKGYHECTPA